MLIVQQRRTSAHPSEADNVPTSAPRPHVPLPERSRQEEQAADQSRQENLITDHYRSSDAPTLEAQLGHEGALISGGKGRSKLAELQQSLSFAEQQAATLRVRVMVNCCMLGCLMMVFPGCL